MDQLTFDMNDGETLSENIIDTLDHIIEEVCKNKISTKIHKNLRLERT